MWSRDAIFALLSVAVKIDSQSGETDRNACNVYVALNSRQRVRRSRTDTADRNFGENSCRRHYPFSRNPAIYGAIAQVSGVNPELATAIAMSA